MTSPHAASEEIIASTATTVLDDSPPNVYLTAADHAAVDANTNPKSSNAVQTTENPADPADTPIKDELDTMDQLHISQKSISPPIAIATTELPRTPPAQIKHEITISEPAIPETPELEDGQEEFPQIALAEQQQLDTLSDLMSYQGAPGSAEMLNGQVINPASMANLAAQDMQYNHDLMALPPYEDHQSHLPLNDETRISAYALLEFEDGQFYMNTYQVILGRDLAAAKAAMRRDAELEKEKQRQEAEGAGESQTPARVKREGSKSRHAKSVISESAGILREGNDSDSDDRARRRKKASKKTKSTGSTSQRVSRRPSLVQPIQKIDYQPQPPARRQAPDTIGAVPVDPGSLRPSPHDCPIIGIHPPATTPASGYKAISRQHVKIAYNSKKSLFEAEIIGRNGAFIDDQFYYHQDVIPLKSGSRLQIGGVVVRFVLPDVAIGETGAETALEQEGAAPERYIEGDKEMSFDFDRPLNAADLRDSSDEESNDADIPQPGIEHDDDEYEEQQAQYEEEQQAQHGFDDDDDDEISSLSDVPDDEDEDQQESSEVKEEEEPEIVEHQEHQQNDHLQYHQQQQQQHPQYVQQSVEQQEQPQQQRTGLPSGPDFMLPMPKKRGPGRPPKNGIMSKREQQLAKKEAQQRALEEQMQQQPDMGMGMGMSVSGKNKVGRPRKNPLLDDQSPVKTEKRKYTKRKPKEDNMGFPHQHSGSGDENGFPKQYKEKKSTKPPRSPSPTFNEADLTPEQLAKPQANYVTLIHEALSNSPTGQMSLPQIYRAIQRRYPFFVLKCNTNGWQSSVRHNLSQHHAFRKVERDGKGWMWAIVDGVSIEKEKKRRPTPPHQLPPHMQQQPLYRAGPPPHMMYGPPGSMPPPGYMHPGMPPHMRPPGPPYMGGPMPGYGMPPGPPQPHMNGHPPPGYPPMPMPQALAPQTGGYSSPYAPKPPTGPPQAQQQQPQAPMMPQQHAPPLAQQPYQQQQPRPIQQAPPQNHDAQSQRAKLIEGFRASLVNSLKQKTNKADAIVTSAINRVNGLSTQSTAATDAREHQIEKQILDALTKLVANFPLPAPQQQPPPNHPHHGGPPPQQPYGQPPMQPPPGQQPAHQSPYGQPTPQQMQPPSTQSPNTTTQQSVQSPYQQPQVLHQQPQQAPAVQQGEPARQPSAGISPHPAAAQQVSAEGAQKPFGPGTTVQRPSFSGQNRAVGPSMPRPPMLTPGMSRTASASGTPANTTATRSSTSASPPTRVATPVSATVAAPALPNGASTAESPQSAPVVAEVVSVTPLAQQQAAAPVAAPEPTPFTQQSASAIPQLEGAVPATPCNSFAEDTTTAPTMSNGTQAGSTPHGTLDQSPVNENGKRPLEKEMNGKENQEFKRINSGPPALKA